MNSDLTASTSEKGSQGATNPFNQIVELEQAQAARLEAEKAKLQKELQTAKEQAASKKAELEARLKKSAMGELTEFKNGEPVAILQAANKDAEAIRKQYEDKFKQRSPEVAKTIVQSYLQAL